MIFIYKGFFILYLGACLRALRGSVMDLVMLVCQLLRQDLRELRELVNTIELVKSWDEG